jgi:heme A synthase
VLVLATIVVGGYVAGTEGEGTASEPVLGAHLACGQEFPTCLGEFMPFGTSSLVDAQLTHRLFMYLAAIAVLALAAISLRARRRDPLPLIAAGVLVTQILLGAINVWAGKHAGLIVAHLTIGTLLWALLALTWIRYDSALR